MESCRLDQDGGRTSKGNAPLLLVYRLASHEKLAQISSEVQGVAGTYSALNMSWTSANSERQREEERRKSERESSGLPAPTAQRFKRLALSHPDWPAVTLEHCLACITVSNKTHIYLIGRESLCHECWLVLCVPNCFKHATYASHIHTENTMTRAISLN